MWHKSTKYWLRQQGREKSKLVNDCKLVSRLIKRKLRFDQN